ncbi:hypothetical protein Tco_1154754 [Tanacetum coccineum]
MMKGSDIGIQDKRSKLFNEWERFTSTDGESIDSYYHCFLKLMNDFKRNKQFPEKIASNLKFLNSLQPEWRRHVNIVHQTKDLHEVDYTQLYDFLKYNRAEVNELRAERLARAHDLLALMENSNNLYNYSVFQQDQPSKNAVQNPGIWNVGNQNGLIVVPGITNQNPNPNGNGNVVASRAKVNAIVNNGIQLQAKEFDFMAAAGDLEEIEEVNANCILMANLQQASTLGTQTDKPLVYDSDGSAEEAAKFVRDFKSLAKDADESLAKHKALEFKIECLLRAVVSQDIMSIMQSNSNVDTSNLQTELYRVDNTAKTRRPQPRSNTKNDRVPSTSKSSCIKNKEVEVEEHHRNLLLSKNKKHMSSECNNKHKPKVTKTKKVGSKERLASPKPRKPRTYLRWSPTRRMFDLKGKLIESNESESQSDYSKGDNACMSNPHEPTRKRFPNFTYSLVGRPNLFMVRRLGMFKAYDRISKASHKFRLEVLGNRPLWK